MQRIPKAKTILFYLIPAALVWLSAEGAALKDSSALAALAQVGSLADDGLSVPRSALSVALAVST